MIIATLKIKPVPEKRQEVLSLLRFMQGPTLVKPGCLACEISETHGDDPVIQYVEQWQTQEGLSRHIQSDLFVRVLTAMELAREEPEIRFYEVAEARGLEFIEALRLGNIQQNAEGEN
jgi:quinol monooxygenase YgiN